MAKQISATITDVTVADDQSWATIVLEGSKKVIRKKVSNRKLVADYPVARATIIKPTDEALETMTAAVDKVSFDDCLFKSYPLAHPYSFAVEDDNGMVREVWVQEAWDIESEQFLEWLALLIEE